ncbi:beta-xylosidase [Haloferula luteola]|uniref:Beta-xylosidase n=1 Tax=Haloferula luteola TaxID=595692 RepID=A0A840V293_9BACT|nr:glycoside hydrolase family 43 protein [Haloferula luteola]MBB5351563.1 beta-xylosidase [Haloferula luteola]
MKRLLFPLLIACSTPFSLVAEETAETRGNPIVTDLFTADPCPMVHGDTLYIYTGHDEQTEEGKGFVMNDWYCFSTQDMVTYEKHGPLLSWKDFSWSKGDAFASHVIEHEGKFFWFVSIRHKDVKVHEGFAIGVAVSDRPTGPFKDAIGKALITDETPNSVVLNIDPAVYIDDDGQAYLFWGSWNAGRWVKLKDSLLELDGEVQTLEADHFFEAPFVHKKGETYYLTYASHYPSTTEYSTSKSITGPWTYGGVIHDLLPKSETNHQGIVEFKGQTYFVYHNAQLPGGTVFRRSLCVDKLEYQEDGSIKKVVRTTTSVPKVE